MTWRDALGCFAGLCLALALAGCRTAPATRSASIVILAGRLVDPATGSVATDQQIVIEGRRITAVGSRVRRPRDARVIDLSRYTVLPGLIDAHVHIGIGGTPSANALADLRAGFTTVVDLGARTPRVLRVRDSIAAGLLPGPRILAAGIWIGRQSGVCEFNGIGIAGGPEAFAQRARENIASGADVLKVCTSGWPADAHARPDEIEMHDAAVEAVVREGHAAGKLVVAHAISRGSIQAALRTGVDGFAHMSYLDSASAHELARRSMFMISTLASLTTGDSSVASRELIASAHLAYRAGVPILLGTDGGVLPHGRNAEEFAALQSAGLTTLDAIRAATTRSALAFRLADSLGVIRSGMVADVIAVDGDPLRDLAALTRVRFVMSAGREVELPPQAGVPRE